MTDPIATPSNMVPMVGVSYGAEGEPAIPVTALNPLPVMSGGAGGPDGTAFAGYWETEGTISAAGELVELTCPGAASAAVEIVGTFDGSLEAVGKSHSNAGLDGERLIFQTGVGSLGKNVVTASGTFDLEWRNVAGGYAVAIRAKAWNSGSVTIRLSATANPSAIFLVGPARTSLEEATRAGRAFLASAPSTSAQASQQLDVILRNNETDKTLWLLQRELGSTVQGTQYRAFINPTATLANSGPISPLRQGATIPAGITTSYEVRANGTSLGGTGASGLPFDFRESINVLYAIEPGGSVGFSITGAGGGALQNQAVLGVRFYAYWETFA